MGVLEVSQDGHVRTIRMNRPEKKNALSLELAWGVIHAVEDAAQDDDVWLIGLRGTGDAFCSGLDLTPSADGVDHSGLTEQEAYLDDLGWVSWRSRWRPTSGSWPRAAA